MTLIEALLSMPRCGAPMIASQKLATILAAGPAKFVQRHAALWSLTDDGRRFLVQFHPHRSEAITQVAVKLAVEDDGPVFHLMCDAGTVRRVRRSELHRNLREIQRDNPGVKITFEYRAPGRLP